MYVLHNENGKCYAWCFFVWLILYKKCDLKQNIKWKCQEKEKTGGMQKGVRNMMKKNKNRSNDNKPQYIPFTNEFEPFEKIIYNFGNSTT